MRSEGPIELFSLGLAVGVIICACIAVWDVTNRDQRLIDNGYAHYDGKTGDFIFHEKETP